MVLPSGTEIPPIPHLLVLLAGTALVVVGLYRVRPAISDRTILALAPWMVVGSALYAAYQVGVVPEALAPFASSPAVYLSAFVLAGAVWVAAGVATDRPLRIVAGAGGVAFLVPVAAVLAAGVDAGGVTPGWPAIALAVSLVLAGATWLGLQVVVPESAAATGGVGALVVLGHALDGVSTAVGVDVLGFAEQTPLSRVLLDLAAGLPTEPVLGVGWLFVLVKLGLAAAIVHLFAGFVREEPTEGWLLLGVVAAVGLGPGAHNVLLYTAAQPGF